VLVIPLVSWLWLGGAVVGLGAVIAAMPQPKRREAVQSLVEAPATVGD
jgi:cytochrome c biogenesis factor